MNPLSVKDINEFRIFRTSRITNPLDPEYTVPGEEVGTKVKIGKIEGSSSKRLHPEEVNRVVSFSLKNDDIDGSKIGTTGNPYIKEKNRRDFRELNVTQDIPGAQRSTLKKGMKTKRCLNPLVPDYKYPGHLQDQEYVRSLYDPNYKIESESIGIVGAIGKRPNINGLQESKINDDQPAATTIPMPDYQFESLIQENNGESNEPQIKEGTPKNDDNEIEALPLESLVVAQSSKSSKSKKSLKSAQSKSQISENPKKKKDFVVKRRKSKLPLHK